ncbi:hypothetical protein Xazr_12950 [Xanthomonas campestris pv. azadirachtae]|nr:hypothetical protein Xazr_12950 [Xanthomonas campestris pv. azadirachtae]
MPSAMACIRDDLLAMDAHLGYCRRDRDGPIAEFQCIKNRHSITHQTLIAYQAPLRNLIWFAYGDRKSAVQTGGMRVW